MCGQKIVNSNVRFDSIIIIITPREFDSRYKFHPSSLGDVANTSKRLELCTLKWFDSEAS